MTVTTSTSVTFTAPMPGLEGLDAFTLRGIDGAYGLFALEAAAGAIRLFVADAAVYAPGYAPAVPADAVSAGQNIILLVVNPGQGKPTVNLAAPLVLNPETGLCTQLILDSNTYPLQAELGAK